jgi:hypothetical protein
MNKLPDCPRCGEDELWVAPYHDLRVRCYRCNWDSGIIVVGTGETVDQAIAKAVEEYRISGEPDEWESE